MFLQAYNEVRQMNDNHNDMPLEDSNRKQYEVPALIVYGAFANLTNKTGGPGNDNNGLKRSVG
jgi:hypothetical protein